LVYAIIQLHIKSEPAGILPPATLEHIGDFTKTLHKIYTFCEAQQDGNKLKLLFRQNETNKLFNECRAGLQQASEVLKIATGGTILTDALKLRENTQKLHEELLDLIQNTIDQQSSDRSSSIYTTTDSQNSSTSFGILPAKPKIFHGRESELNDILKVFNEESPRIAILGAGGIGKISLARAALHHPDISSKYEESFFVACDSATTGTELAALVGSILELKPGKNPTKTVVQYFLRGPPCLLVLDNMATAWERAESRSGVEEFLSLMTDVPHLALIITMRGAERPAKVGWTRPLLSPLAPLSDAAAQQTFLDITDNFNDNVIEVLQLTDNMPLAVNLLAHLVDYEGCSSVLNCWKTEKTLLLSEGPDKMSNLNALIAISLSSPRMTSGAMELLRLLSLLPDGLSDIELIQSNLPINNILTCKVVLLQTSLAYNDKMRLKVLAPIREHMQQLYPTSSYLVQSLQTYFQSLLELYQNHRGVQTKGVINQIASNLGNLHQILLHGM
ncbi:hypothetical protein FB451DRAFT_1498459, partial [Mycena latifolia]